MNKPLSIHLLQLNHLVSAFPSQSVKKWLDKQKDVTEMQIAQKTKENTAHIEPIVAMQVKFK